MLDILKLIKEKIEISEISTTPPGEIVSLISQENYPLSNNIRKNVSFM